MKIKVKDGKGTRIITEIKRPDPQAVLVLKEEIELEVSNSELHTLVELGYVNLVNVELIGSDKQIKNVYPDTILFHDAPAKAEPVKVTPKVEQKKG
jgi:hypothetical protein